MRTRLTLTREHVAGAVVLHVAGEVDVGSVDCFERALAAAYGDAALPGPVVVDITGVPFLSACGLEALLGARQQCGELGLHFTVAADHRTVLRILSVTASDQMLRVVPSVPHALARTPREPTRPDATGCTRARGGGTVDTSGRGGEACSK